MSSADELRQALLSQKRVFLAVALFSAVVNLLYLAPSLYMLQLYDRVLASRSEVTLLMLSLIVLGAYALIGGLDYLRARVMIRLGNRLDRQLAERVFSASHGASLSGHGGATASVMNDLTTVRQFVAGSGTFAFFDAPWAPIYLLVIWMFHPMLGAVALAGTVLLVFLTWLNERVSRDPLGRANQASRHGSQFAGNVLRNAEVIEAMGMLPALRQRWQNTQDHLLGWQTVASDRAAAVSAMSRSSRLVLQSAALGVGALLVIAEELTPGMMIAASILTGRALAPVEQLIAVWKQFALSRMSWDRLRQLLTQFPRQPQRMPLPAPTGLLRVEQVVIVPPGGSEPVVRGVSLAVQPGQILAVVGPSASGKSSLARVLVGVWAPRAGSVRLDGAEVYTWNKSELGPHLGYLPQDIELFAGTVAENISRFGVVDSDKVVAAARQAGLHDMILRLPKGYDTPIGDAGAALSGGQRQRIALARALYCSPRLLVLDEPNASLDDAGEAALVQALQSARASGASIVLITHRPRILGIADQIAVLKDGLLAAQGPRDEILPRLSGAARPDPSSRPAITEDAR